MRRPVAVLLAVVGIGSLVIDHSRVGCWLRGQHDPARARTGLGGFRCSRCGKPGSSLDDFMLGTGYVSPSRAIYSRSGAGGRPEFTRSLPS